MFWLWGVGLAAEVSELVAKDFYGDLLAGRQQVPIVETNLRQRRSTSMHIYNSITSYRYKSPIRY